MLISVINRDHFFVVVGLFKQFVSVTIKERPSELRSNFGAGVSKVRFKYQSNFFHKKLIPSLKFEAGNRATKILQIVVDGIENRAMNDLTKNRF